MNKKMKYASALLLIVSICLLGMILLDGRKNLLNLRASINIEDNNEVIDAAKNMAKHNIDKIKGEVVYTVEELVEKEYLTGDEINPATNKKYDKDTRVVVVVKDNQIYDVYITNILFRDKINCDSICYLNDSYITFNNDVYRVIKIDKEGYIYITNNEVKSVKNNSIDSYLKIVYNSLDKSIVYNVINLKYDDIKNSNAVVLNQSVTIDTNDGRKLYEVDNEDSINEDNRVIKVLPVIVLDNNLKYEKGNGSLINPYVLGR